MGIACMKVSSKDKNTRRKSPPEKNTAFSKLSFYHLKFSARIKRALFTSDGRSIPLSKSCGRARQGGVGWSGTGSEEETTVMRLIQCFSTLAEP